MPLLIYGADIDMDEMYNGKLVSLVDYSPGMSLSQVVSPKDIFKKFIKYYDRNFHCSRNKNTKYIKSADELLPTERVQKIAQCLPVSRTLTRKPC
jgi:hypothetical protein